MSHHSEEGTSVDDDNLLNADEDGKGNNFVSISINRRIEMPPAFHFPEDQTPPSDLLGQAGGAAAGQQQAQDALDNASTPSMINQIYHEFDQLSTEEKNQLLARSLQEELLQEEEMVVPEVVEDEDDGVKERPPGIIRRTNLKGQENSSSHDRNVCFDPLALLLDASLEGELDLVMRTAKEVRDPSASNDEGITALHNAICAGHFDIVRFLVEFGCDVNAQDSDGWTPLHCAASCNNLPMVRFLVEHGACVFATTFSDHETAAEKCEEDEEGFQGCSDYLLNIQEKLGLMNNGEIFAVYDYVAASEDELSFTVNDSMMVMKRGDDVERDWWWSRRTQDGKEGYVPKNLLGLCPRVLPQQQQHHQSSSSSMSVSENSSDASSIEGSKELISLDKPKLLEREISAVVERDEKRDSTSSA